jgi:hypothetical protein
MPCLYYCVSGSRKQDKFHSQPNYLYLPIEKAEMVLRFLLEGNSVSSVERITEVHHTTIFKLLILAGDKCERIMAEKVRNVKVRDVECDEL